MLNFAKKKTVFSLMSGLWSCKLTALVNQCLIYTIKYLWAIYPFDLKPKSAKVVVTTAAFHRVHGFLGLFCECSLQSLSTLKGSASSERIFMLDCPGVLTDSRSRLSSVSMLPLLKMTHPLPAPPPLNFLFLVVRGTVAKLLQIYRKHFQQSASTQQRHSRIEWLAIPPQRSPS